MTRFGYQVGPDVEGFFEFYAGQILPWLREDAAVTLGTHRDSRPARAAVVSRWSRSAWVRGPIRPG